MATRVQRMRFHSPHVMLAGTLAVFVFTSFVVFHWDYYGLSRMERPFHADHRHLRPSGTWGLWLGTVATALFVLNLGYLVRKRLIRIAWLGPLRRWMDVHAVTGLVGAGLIVLHSAMAPSSALGILAVFALGITVVTGIVGRTIYIRVPRSVEGRELEFKQVQDALERFRTELELAGVQAEWLHRTQPEARPHRTGVAGGFVAMVVGDRQRQQEFHQLKRHILESERLKGTAKQILPLAKAYCMHWQWLVRYRELRSLIASWRFFHRWLAVLMLCVVVGHILVAIRFGNLGWRGGF